MGGTFFQIFMGYIEDKLALIDQRTAEMAELQKKEARDRKLAVVFAVAGALFAAARLGLVAVPFIKEKRRKKV